MTELVLMAGFVAFVIYRIYTTLGQDDGPPEGRSRPDPNRPPPSVSDVKRRGDNVTHPDAFNPEPIAPAAPVFRGQGAAGLEEIYQADKDFRTETFLTGARAAYEMIVNAFGRGDLPALRPWLDDDVFEAWGKAIAARNEADMPWSLNRIKNMEIESADLDGHMARIVTRIDAVLSDGATTRTVNDLWTFMRDVRSDTPNWLLDDVEVAR